MHYAPDARIPVETELTVSTAGYHTAVGLITNGVQMASGKCFFGHQLQERAAWSVQQ